MRIRTDHPTLIVDGHAADWLPDDSFPLGEPDEPPRNTVRIDGPLPTVMERCRDRKCPWSGHPRPLRADDRVTLYANVPCTPRADLCTHEHCGSVPFATATVANIEPHLRTAGGRQYGPALVTVTDVQPLEES